MKIPRRAAGLTAAVPLAVAATFVPGLGSHEGTHALPAVRVQQATATKGTPVAVDPNIRRDPTANPAVQAALAGAAGGAAGKFTAVAVDFIVKMTKKLVTLAEDEAETAASDSSSSGAKPQEKEFNRLFPSGDSQFNARAAG